MKIQFNIFILFLAIFFSSNSRLSAEVKNKDIIGEWTYEASDTPYGYEKGSLIFSEKEGKTTCVIKLENGEMTVSDLKIEKNKVTFTTFVDGNSINVELIREKNKLTGHADTPEGPKTITAVKK